MAAEHESFKLGLDNLEQCLVVKETGGDYGGEDRPFNVYLAGPITCNSEDESREYEKVRKAIKLAFTNCTEATYNVYDPCDYTALLSPHTAPEVYRIDHERTRRADLVFFNVNSPSLGVGIESQIAADATVPRVVAYKDTGKKPSRMFLGIFSPTIKEIVYKDPEDLEEKLQQMLPDITAYVRDSAERRRPIFSSLISSDIGRRILQRRILLGMRREELAAMADIRDYWIFNLERHADMVTCMSLAMLHRLADVLQFSVSLNNGSITMKALNTHLEQHVIHSLENLAAFVLGADAPPRDETVLRIWRDEMGRPEAAYNRNMPMGRVWSLDDWKERYLAAEEEDRELF